MEVRRSLMEVIILVKGSLEATGGVGAFIASEFPVCNDSDKSPKLMVLVKR
jgi:hypothetical protein